MRSVATWMSTFSSSDFALRSLISTSGGIDSINGCIGFPSPNNTSLYDVDFLLLDYTHQLMITKLLWKEGMSSINSDNQSRYMYE